MTDADKFQRRIERERLARKEAERLLEEKSAALYEKNLELFALSESLEKLVAERTAQMQKARDDALNALKVKTDFIANMSHELRTPMNGVLGVLTLLQNEKVSPAQRELLDIAESSGKHLLEVINDILDFSKIEANKISIELGPVEIAPYLSGVAAPFVLQAKQKNIALNVEVDPSVEKTLTTDKLRLTQIITNLLSNAIKFTHSGTVNLRFKRLEQGRYRLQVIDTGIGISQENLKSVFSAFEQADTSITREFGGTGLGMNITKRLVDMLGGTIDIESTLGEGTTFTVDVSMDLAPELSASQSTHHEQRSNTLQAHLLLVEDHKVNQLVAQRLLETWGFDVSLAENGAQALEMVKQADYHGILMDLQMPVMGGVQAAKVMRNEGLIADSIPIIAMTAHSSDEHIKECFNAGMQAHVSKPLDKDILLSVLQKHVTQDIDANEESADLPPVNIAHLNLQSALPRVGGDWLLLHSLLSRFLLEFTDFLPVFQQAKADDMTDYAISMLHKIKGSGGNLGMQALSELASSHEAMLLEHNTWPSDDVIQQMSQMLEETRRDFEALASPADAQPEKSLVSASPTQILAQISLIEQNLKQDVFAAEAALNELLSFDLDATLLAVLKSAETAMQAFDTQAVAKALTQARLTMD
ncbi:ATP-binding protein [Glaciecola siphonariae]|uniref:histidine kinase n=1 Tax=Glaciecola siphonariae TaxID=521012 RepID=A0ABV9M056_9ALTE